MLPSSAGRSVLMNSNRRAHIRRRHGATDAGDRAWVLLVAAALGVFGVIYMTAAWTPSSRGGMSAARVMQSPLDARYRGLVARQAMSFGMPVKKPDGDEDENEEEEEKRAKKNRLKMEAFAEAEEEDEEMARKMASTEDMADFIAQEVIAGSALDEDSITAPKPPPVPQAPVPQEPGEVIPSAPIRDYTTLSEKWGGWDRVYEDHRLTTEDGFFTESRLKELKDWVKMCKNDTESANQWYVEYEYEGGSRLMLVGTNHINVASNEFVRKVVREEKPECLVIERRLGDDSLQRLTVPERVYTDVAMAKPPTERLSTDSYVDRVRKFHQDRMWLEGFRPWKDIGAEAAFSQEFGIAVEEFVKLREEGLVGGPRGGTICFGDADLRLTYQDGIDAKYKPALSDFSLEGPNVPLRDLLLAQAMRAAVKTHRSAVAIVGRDHMEGIARLLKQDARVTVKKQGVHLADPMWLKDLQDGAKKWERAASARNSMFARMADTTEKRPFGTFITADAAAELIKMRRESESRIQKEGLEAEPASPVSSVIAAKFFERGDAVTPSGMDELQAWLNGEDIEEQFAGYFPFENPQQRKKSLEQLPKRETYAWAIQS